MLLASVCFAVFAALVLVVIDAGTSAPDAAGFQPGGVPTQTPMPTPTPTPAPQIPVILWVEVRPDRSLALEWTQASGASSYDIGYRTPGGTWTVAATTTAPAVAETVHRVIKAEEDWPAMPGIAYEIGVRSNAGAQTWSVPAPVTPGLTRLDVAGSGLGSSVQVSWNPVAVGEPFVAYEVLVGTASDRIDDCLSTSVATRSTTTATAASTGAACGGAAIAAADYTVGVRTVRNALPLVFDQTAVATAANGFALPAERFGTAEVAGRWEIVDQAGQPVIWNSINMRRGELTSYLFSTTEYTSMLDQGFDSVRIVMEWDKFQREPGVMDQSSFGALDRAVDWAEDAGINLILDPLHLAEGPDWNIPDWAWGTTNDGVRDDALVLDAIRENATDYLRYVAQRYRSRPHVIAIDVVNEPREPADGSLDARNVVLIELYHDLIATIRDLETDKPLILQPYYGSSKTSAERIGEIDDATEVDPNPNPADFEGLIWSVHDYYAGREGTATDDGYTNGGYPLRGTAADGTRHRTESFSGTGCYPSGPTADQCTNDTSRADVLRPSMLVHLGYHVDQAQLADMPVYVGEFGIPHDGFGFPGWAGAEQYLTDKVATFDELGVSRALWAWRIDVDPTFGMYSRTTREWHPWTPYATGAAQIPLPATRGDVNCDGNRNIVDALFVAQFAALVRTASTCPLSAPATQIDAANGDLNGDLTTNIVDALLIAQCAADIALEEC